MFGALRNGNNTLQELSVSGNQLKEGGEGTLAEIVSEALRDNQCRLKRLNLGDNQIKGEEARRICEAMLSNTCLQSLDIFGCRIICRHSKSLIIIFRNFTICI